ncbi:MAG TPA: 2'-5' RNA ligase family protein [Acidimicrobiales bacterium]
MRLFVAVQPPPAVLDALEALPRPERPGIRWTKRAHWHVTLRFLGEVADPAPVVEALEGAPVQRCVARLGPGAEVLGRGVVSVPVAGLDDLATGVAAALGGMGTANDDRRFRGHVTLARTARGGARGAVRAVVRELADRPVSATFDVDEVRLVRSHLGGGPPRYEDLYVRHLR